MQDVYRNGRFEPDPWTVFDAEAAPVSSTHAIVPKARLVADEAQLLASGARLGVLISAGESLEDVAHLLPHLSLIAVAFPKFNDGRGFSIARLLRDRLGYKGPLRAVGDVLLDLIPHMERVGFDEFTVTNEPTRKALAAGHLPQMPLFYQPAWNGDVDEAPVPAGRPWLRRAV
jgi:phosphoadenosine phosphosulfate reductase